MTNDEGLGLNEPLPDETVVPLASSACPTSLVLGTEGRLVGNPVPKGDECE